MSKTNILNYKPEITVLHVEDDKEAVKQLRSELIGRRIFVHSVDNLADAIKVIKSCTIDFLVCDGMFPVKKGLPEAKSFIPLAEKIRSMKKNIDVIAWSNSTHVHEYCKEHGMKSYSKMVLTRERFKEKGREYIPVECVDAQKIAGLIEQEILKKIGFEGLMRKCEFENQYSEPATILGVFLSGDARTRLFERTADSNYNFFLTEINHGVATLQMNVAEDKKISKLIYDKIIKKRFFPKVYAGVISCSKKLLRFVRPLKTKDFSAYTSKSLASHYLRFCDLFMTMRTFSSIPMALEHGNSAWTSLLKDILRKRISDEQEMNEVFSLLTTPDRISYTTQFKLEITKIGIKRCKCKSITKDIDSLLDRFAWVNYTFEGIPLGKKDIIEKIESLGKTKDDFESIIRANDSRLKELKMQKRQIIERYGLSKEEMNMFDIGAGLVFLKFYRKGVFAESYYNVESLLEEIGKRIGCSMRQVANMLPYEVLAALEIGSFPYGLIDSRIEESVLFHRGGKTIALSSHVKAMYAKDAITYSGNEAIKGQTAYPGKVKGKVKIVNVAADMAGFKDGYVLVSRATNPSLIPVMERCSAMITDLGGLTCHAAIVARELKKPCVVGTKIATKVLKDGDMVEVDANLGMIKKLA
ncbi:MAG: PEP-utilizing enzyme [archaeon]